VIPSIGKVKLGNLKPAQLDTLYRQLALTETTRGQRANDANPVPLSSRTVHHIHVVLHTALAHAVRAGDLPTNVCDRVSAPKVKATKRTVPNVDDLKRLLADSASDPLLPLWVTAVATGARLGELLGLQWTDLDSDNMTLHIHQTLLGCDAGTPVWGEPKTEAGKRTISVPAEVISVLHNHRQSQRENGSKVYAAYNLIFAAGNGNPLMQRNVVRSFKAALRRAGLPETIRIHDLRHAHATALRATGADIKDVSERLGHRDTTITNDLYTHAIAGRDASVAARFGVAMGW
jgi:integrase